MKRYLLLAIAGSALAISLATTACKSDDDDEDKCCPISETFVCSGFKEGGARSLHKYGCSGGASDNLPVSIKTVDSEGCPYWAPDPKANGARTCGGGPRPFIDASVDASNADASAEASAADASADASDAAPE